MRESILTVMTPDPWCISESAPVALAASTLVERHIRHLPVIGGALTDGGRLVGIVDDAVVFARGQILEGRFVPYDSRDSGLVVGDVFSDVRVVMGPNDPLSDLLHKMVHAGTDCAVIVDTRRHPVGIVTAHDLVRVSARFLPDVQVDEIASIPALSVQADQSVGAAFDTMAAHRCRHLMVLDGRSPFAIVSWRDLVERGWDRRLSTTMRDVTKAGVVETIPTGSRLSLAAERMVTQKVGCLPIVSDRCEVMGLVTRTDIVARMAAALVQSEPKE